MPTVRENPLFMRLTALVVDDQAPARALHRNQLAEIGLQQIDVVNGPDDALLRLRKQSYDIILCDYDFKSHTDGQQLLETLRNENVLPAGTVFVLITGNSERRDVSATTEHVPDDYIVKPLSTAALEKRLTNLLNRRAAMQPVLQRIRLKDYTGAVRVCDEMLAKGSDFPAELMRRKAECLLEMGKFNDARDVYETVLRTNSNLAWARMGEARAYHLQNEVDAAKEVLRGLIESHPQNMQAYDYLARIAEETNDSVEALQVLANAVKHVGSARRHRALGQAAMRAGQLETARDSLKQAFRLDKGAITAQAEDGLMLAQVHVDLGESKAAMAVLGEAGAQVKGNPGAERALAAVRSQALKAQGNLNEAEAALKEALQGAEAKADLNSVLVAKAALAIGMRQYHEQGAALMASIVKVDHDNAKLVDMARQALVSTGNEKLVSSVIDAAVESLQAEVAQARSLMKERAFLPAIEKLEAVLVDFPENTAALIETVRAYLLNMSFNGLTLVHQKRAELLIAKLDRLMPRADKVQALHHFLARVKTKEKEKRA